MDWKLAKLPVYLADFIPKGQTLALTYAVTVTDSEGATSTQTVTVDITGTDNPAVVWIHTTGDGSPDALWSTAQNWETGTVPTATDDAIIITDQLSGLTPVYPVTINSAAFAKSLTMNDFGTLFTDSPTLINQSTLTIGSGGISLKADSIVENDKLATISVAGLMEVLAQSSLQNFGQITLQDGGDFKDQSTITNFASGTIDVSGGTLNVLVDIANSGFVAVDTGATLALSAATIDGGTVTINGTLELDVGAVLNNGSLGNFGQINVSGTGNALDHEAVTANHALEVMAGGALTIDLGSTVANGGGTITVDGTATLTLNDAILNGGRLVNDGTVDSTSTSAIDNANITNSGTMESTGGVLTIDPALSMILINSGTLQANGGELDIANEPVTNTGTLQAIDDSILKLSSLTVTNTDGTVSDDSGSTIDLVGSVISGGTLTISGILDATGTSAIDDANITNSGTLESTGGTFTIDAASSLTNTGTLEANGGNLIIDTVFSGNAEITGASMIELGASSSNAYSAATITFAAGATGTLVLDHAKAFNGAVVGLEDDNTIDLRDITYGSIRPSAMPTEFCRSGWACKTLPISSSPATIPGCTGSLADDGTSQHGTDLIEVPGVISGLNSHGNASEGSPASVSITDGGSSVLNATYEWQIFDTALNQWVDGSGTGVSNATYVPAEQEEGQALQVKISFTDALGNVDHETLSAGTVNPVADLPVVTASATPINEDGTSNLTITLTNAAGLFENSDDSVTVTVTLDHGATLHGTGVTDNHDGTFTLTAHSATDLSGLTITPASEFEGTVTVGVSAVAHDGAAVSTAGTTSATLTVNPVADQPIVSASATPINEDGTSNLTITLTNAAGLFENSDDSVTVTVTLDHGATLHGTGVTDNHDGTFTLTAHSATDLSGLTITPASEFEGTVTVGVSAVAQDGAAVSSAGTTWPL